MELAFFWTLLISKAVLESKYNPLKMGFKQTLLETSKLFPSNQGAFTIALDHLI
jgi:hypothetical protein